MIKMDNLVVSNIEGALRGMRNPLESWHKCDSKIINIESEDGKNGSYIEIGSNDKELGRKLARSGSSHRKFLRQIFVCVDITAPSYWWKEFDTYKVGTVANSTSTMHTLMNKKLSDNMLSLFSTDGMSRESMITFIEYVDYLETLRLRYIKSKDKYIWEDIIKMLPSNYNYMRTVTFNYENLISMYYDRRNHKLKEWREFCKWIEDEIPYAKDFILIKDE